MCLFGVSNFEILNVLISGLKFGVCEVIWGLIFLCLQKLAFDLQILSGQLIIWGL